MHWWAMTGHDCIDINVCVCMIWKTTAQKIDSFSCRLVRCTVATNTSRLIWKYINYRKLIVKRFRCITDGYMHLIIHGFFYNPLSRYLYNIYFIHILYMYVCTCIYIFSTTEFILKGISTWNLFCSKKFNVKYILYKYLLLIQINYT